MPDSTKRFSNRVASYIKYRPSYPSSALDALERIACSETPTTIADIGSGTGIFSKLLLDRGHMVFGIEPNAAMRQAAEQQLSLYSNFRSIDGKSESTQLPEKSVDLIVAAQAFHWFDLAPTRQEFARILKPGGFVALVWNQRLTDATPFLKDYEALLNSRGTDYQAVNHANISDSDIEAFFAPVAVEILSFPNQQLFDYQGLAGRCQSSSYVPAEGSPGHREFFTGLREIFDRNSQNGQVSFDYQTKVYVARFSEGKVR